MVKLLRVGNNRKAHDNVKDRMFATKVQLSIEANIAGMKPQERLSPRARNLGLIYAFCLTQHLPATQSIPYISADNRIPFDIEGCDETLFKDMFKFDKKEFARLMNAGLRRQVSERDDQGEVVRHGVDNNDRGIVATRQRVTVTAQEAFLIMLYRSTSGSDLKKIGQIFHIHPPVLTDICLACYERVLPVAERLFGSFDSLAQDPVRMQRYKDAITAKCGYGELGMFMFIDGTFDEIFRPTRGQQACYSKHKKSHGLTYMGCRAPDGLCVNFFGPIEGRHHDAFVTQTMNMVQQLQRLSRILQILCAGFGNSAFYGFLPELQHSYKDVPATTPAQTVFTEEMKKGRIVIEWLYGERDCWWKVLKNKHAMKVYLSPVRAITFTCVLLTNCLTCLRGSNATSHFNCLAPLLEDYLQL